MKLLKWTMIVYPLKWLIYCLFFQYYWIFELACFPGSSDNKESACNEGDPGSIPGSGRSSGEGNGYLLQYSCLENPKDRGARWATVHGVTKSWTEWVSNTFTFFTFILSKGSVMPKRRQDLRMRLSWRMQCSPRGVLGKQFKVHPEQEGKALESQARKHEL